MCIAHFILRPNGPPKIVDTKCDTSMLMISCKIYVIEYKNLKFKDGLNFLTMAIAKMSEASVFPVEKENFPHFLSPK